MSDRARQFLPFDALSGFKKEIKKKERIIVKKKELSEDEIEILNQRLMLVKEGMMISIIYFDNDEYVKKEGIVTNIDYIYKTITIVQEKILIENIIELTSEEIPEYID